MKLLSVPLLLLFFFAACTQKQVENKYCSNELSLLSVSDSLKKITIDYSLEAKPLLNAIEAKLGEDLCGKTSSFGLVLANEEAVKIQVRKMCDDRMVSCFIHRREAQILLNKKGLLLLEHEIVSIDSVKYWMQKNFLNKNGVNYREASIHWDLETPKDSIEKTFVAITEGYLLNYEELSEQLFLKKVCDLETSQINILKEKLPFKVRIEFERFLDIPPPPPPPPAIEVIEE